MLQDGGGQFSGLTPWGLRGLVLGLRAYGGLQWSSTSPTYGYSWVETAVSTHAPTQILNSKPSALKPLNLQVALASSAPLEGQGLLMLLFLLLQDHLPVVLHSGDNNLETL